MNRHFIILLVLAIATILTNCKTDKSPIDDNYQKELVGLTTEDSKRIYLEQILKDDQKVRGSKGQELMVQYGKNSDEHRRYIQAQLSQDSINLLKIEKYLKMYGYPGKALRDRATTTPWMVIHHAQGYEVRVTNFELIYMAYRNGDIDDDAVSFYLGRMYQMKYGERFRMKSPYKSEDEINKLIKELDLESVKNKVLMSEIETSI